ncbi:MAG: ABC transporter ATP-binding protein [Acidimicrobiia bacterium]
MMGGGGIGGFAAEELTRDEAKQVVRRLWSMLRPWHARIVVLLVAMVFQTLALLAGPRLVAYAIDSGMATGDMGAVNLAAITYLALALLSLSLARYTVWGLSVVGETFLQDLRQRVFHHMMTLGLDFFEREKTGVLVSRMTSDVDALQQLVQVGILSLAQNVLLFFGALVWIFLLSWQLALCVVVLLIPLYFGSRWFRRESNKAYLDVRDQIGRNLATLQEGLAGVRVVQAYGQEASYFERFNTTNEAQFDANLRAVKIATRFFPPVEFLGVAGVAVIIGVGGVMADNGIITVGTVAAFALYLSNLFEPVQQLSQNYNLVQAGGAALEKLFGLLDEAPSIAERPGAVDLPRTGSLTVRDVSFGYAEGPDVLNDVSLELSPGERLALVGPTGAGKSTLAKLMVRFYDPRHGDVSYGGVDLRDATLASLRERIVVVPQEGFLFFGNIRENIRIARYGATDADIDAAVAALGLTARFAALPDGLDTEVRERGTRLSAGERQLVSLVRAAVADPTVLVLDEATSSLDPGTEQAVEAALERLTEHRTVVVVAHRLTTAARADRVAVVDGGHLVELGTHDDLVRRNGRYAGLFASWAEGQALGRSA